LLLLPNIRQPKANAMSNSYKTTKLPAADQSLQMDALANQTAAYTTEAEWLEACKRGERLAQQWLYNKYSGKMYYVCLKYLGNADDARDIMHDAFVKVFGHISKFRGDAALETWISRIMSNTAINKIRKEARTGIMKDVEKVHLADDDDKTGDFEPDKNISAVIVMKLIADLPPGYRAVISMYAVDGYTHQEIATELGISEGTSKSQLAKARKMLKKQMEALKKDEG